MSATAIDFVLDASALLALLHNEPGAERVRACLDRAAMSTVNLSEVLRVTLQKRAETPATVLPRLLLFGIEPFEFSTSDCILAAELWEYTKTHGLSLGDRACLALGKRLGAKVLTVERNPTWDHLVLPGIRIETIR